MNLTLVGNTFTQHANSDDWGLQFDQYCGCNPGATRQPTIRLINNTFTR